MTAPFPWAEALHISSEQLQQWSHELPPGESLLLWCLETHKISEDEFLQWAAKTSNLPVVRRDFFNRLPTTIEKIQSWIHDNPAWSRHCFPLWEWDGVLFVGCHEAPDRSIFPMPVQFVLAPPSELNKLWGTLHQIRVTPKAEPVRASLPDLPPAPTRPSVLKKESTPVPESVVKSEPIPEPVAKPPRGATLGIEELLTTIQMNFGEKTAEAAQTPTAPVMDVPEGLANISRLNIPDRVSSGPAGLNFKITPENAEPTSPIKLELKPTERPVPQNLQVDLPPLPKEALLGSSLPPSVETPVATATNPIATPATMTENEAVAQSLLQKLPAEFNKSMMILHTNGELVPFTWTGGWTVPKKVTAIPFTDPGVFRIVMNTSLPYHGYVVPNASNDAFFTAWNGGETPRHLTLMPITIEKHLVGMILAISQNSQNLATLHQLERLSVEFSTYYLHSGKKVA